MHRSTPGLPVHHQLPGFTQTHIHRVSDAIQPSHPLLSPSPPALNPSQHQSFPMSQLFEWGGQSTGVSALASFLPKITQGWSPSEWTGWISLQSKGLSWVFSNTTGQKHQFFSASSINPYMTTGKTITLTSRTFVGKVMSLLFNMLSRLVITFLPRSKCLLISWLQSPSAVILEPQKIKSDTISTVCPSISHEVMGPDAMILVFRMLSFKLTFSLLFHSWMYYIVVDITAKHTFWRRPALRLHEHLIPILTAETTFPISNWTHISLWGKYLFASLAGFVRSSLLLVASLSSQCL